MDLQREIAGVFDDLFMATMRHLAEKGIRVEPSDVVRKAISPAKDSYIKGLSELLVKVSVRAFEEQGGQELADGGQ